MAELPPFTVTLKAPAAVTVAGQVTGAELVSSLVIVPWPWLSARVAPVGAERFTKKVSFPSTVVSPFTATVTVLTVLPGLKVRVPELAT